MRKILKWVLIGVAVGTLTARIGEELLKRKR